MEVVKSELIAQFKVETLSVRTEKVDGAAKVIMDVPPDSAPNLAPFLGAAPRDYYVCVYTRER